MSPKQLQRAINAANDRHRQSAVEMHSTWRTVGIELREWRLKRGEALRAMARRLGVSAAYLSDVERGNRNPSRIVNQLVREGA